MPVEYSTNVEYIVYETASSTYSPTEGLKVSHPVAHYENETQMIADWLNEFLDGTHNYFSVMKEIGV